MKYVNDILLIHTFPPERQKSARHYSSPK